MFKKGMKVIKTFKGLGGYRETAEATVGKVSKKENTVWLINKGGSGPDDLETGITYDLRGREKENFFPGMTSSIAPATSRSATKGENDVS